MHHRIPLFNRLVDVFGIFFVVLWLQGILRREHFNFALFRHERACEYLSFAEASEVTKICEIFGIVLKRIEDAHQIRFHFFELLIIEKELRRLPYKRRCVALVTGR